MSNATQLIGPLQVVEQVVLGFQFIPTGLKRCHHFRVRVFGHNRQHPPRFLRVHVHHTPPQLPVIHRPILLIADDVGVAAFGIYVPPWIEHRAEQVAPLCHGVEDQHGVRAC